MKLTKKLLTTALALGLGLAAATANATPLQARYLDSVAGIDAWYDTATTLTWLRDVRHADGTFNLTNPSSLTWVAANAWAAGLGSGWRLPTTVDYSAGEMLALSTEGNMTSAYFQGLVTDPAMRPVYWSSTDVPGWPPGTVHFNFHPTPPGNDSSTDSILASSNTYALAVHAGDVGRTSEGGAGGGGGGGGTVPEPVTLALMGLGLAGLGWTRHRKA